MLTQKQKELANKRLAEFLLEHFGETVQSASNIQLYRALAEVSLKYLHENRSKTFIDANKNKKTVHYMSIEFLIGRNLRNNLWNLGLDEFYTDLLQTFDVNMQMSFSARGTASSDILQLMGLEESEKSVIFSIIREDKAAEALRALEQRFATIKRGKGIAYTVPLSGMIGASLYQFFCNNRKAVREEK